MWLRKAHYNVKCRLMKPVEANILAGRAKTVDARHYQCMSFYDHLLIDINMPMINGFEFSADIRFRYQPYDMLYVITPNKSRSIKRTVHNIEYRMIYYNASYNRVFD